MVDTKPVFLTKWHHKPTGVTVTLFEDWARKDFRTPQHPLAYVLRDNGRVVFRGKDFGCSPLHSIDGLDCLAALLGFLTMRPGDTDREYFDSYTQEQLDWAGSGNAQALSLWVYDRENSR